MTDLSHTFTSHDRILVEAGDLLSDHGGADASDIERDDAIVTLVTRLLGRDDDERSAVRTLIIQHNARRLTPVIFPAEADAIWRGLSPGAKVAWVRAMMPEPEYDDRAWDPSDERAAENRRLAQDAYEDEHGV